MRVRSPSLAPYSGVEQMEARQAHDLEIAGSSPAPATNAVIAQGRAPALQAGCCGFEARWPLQICPLSSSWSEQPAHNGPVPGSSPRADTIYHCSSTGRAICADSWFIRWHSRDFHTGIATAAWFDSTVTHIVSAIQLAISSRAEMTYTGGLTLIMHRRRVTEGGAGLGNAYVCTS